MTILLSVRNAGRRFRSKTIIHSNSITIHNSTITEAAMDSREITLLPDSVSLREVFRYVSFSVSLPVGFMESTG